MHPPPPYAPAMPPPPRSPSYTAYATATPILAVIHPRAPLCPRYAPPPRSPSYTAYATATPILAVIHPRAPLCPRYAPPPPRSPSYTAYATATPILAVIHPRAPLCPRYAPPPPRSPSYTAYATATPILAVIHPRAPLRPPPPDLRPREPIRRFSDQLRVCAAGRYCVRPTVFGRHHLLRQLLRVVRSRSAALVFPRARARLRTLPTHQEVDLTFVSRFAAFAFDVVDCAERRTHFLFGNSSLLIANRRLRARPSQS